MSCDTIAGRASFVASDGYFILLVDPPADAGELRIDWGTLEAAEVYPRKFPEARPVILTGRCSGESAKVRVTGRSFESTIDARQTPGNAALATVWARAKLAGLTSREEITTLALKYGLASDWTSFVTVDSMEKKK